MSPARARTRTARSGVERTNHEATAPLTLVRLVEVRTVKITLQRSFPGHWKLKICLNTVPCYWNTTSSFPTSFSSRLLRTDWFSESINNNPRLHDLCYVLKSSHTRDYNTLIVDWGCIGQYQVADISTDMNTSLESLCLLLSSFFQFCRCSLFKYNCLRH